MKEKYKGVKKLTDNPFLNLYHIDAVDTDGKDFNYYFASRNKENDIKIKTHDIKPEGIVIYGVKLEDEPKLVLIRQYCRTGGRRRDSGSGSSQGDEGRDRTYP